MINEYELYEKVEKSCICLLIFGDHDFDCYFNRAHEKYVVCLTNFVDML